MRRGLLLAAPLESASLPYENGHDAVGQPCQFLRAIAHLNPGAEFHPLLFGGFVHRLRVVCKRCTRSANKRQGGNGRVRAVRLSIRIPIWLTYSAPRHRGHLIDPHCNYCQFFETAIRNPISIVGNRPRSVARRAQASQRNSPLWLCESRGFSKPRA